MENLRVTCPSCNLKRRKKFTFNDLVNESLTLMNADLRNTDDSRQAAAKRGESPPESESKSKKPMSDVAGASAGRAKAEPKFTQEDKAYQAALYLDEELGARLGQRPVEERRLQAWAEAFDKCHRLDGHSWEELEQVLQFSQKDPFWSANILSGGKFREKYVQLLAKMRQEEGKRQNQGRGDFPDYGNREDYV